MKLTVVIVSYNVQHFLQLCLGSVSAALKGIDGEIIVVDNHSTDNSCEMVRSRFPHVHLISNPENVGFAQANNQAVEQASGDYVCFLNPDTVVAEDTFSKIIDYAEDQINLGIVGCKLIDGRGRFLPESKRNLPVMRVAFLKQLGFSKHYYANQLSEDQSGIVPVLVGAFMFMKKGVFNAVDGFDTDYFMYGEDIDLSYRIEQAGYLNHYCADTTILHFKGESTLRDKYYAERFYGAMRIFYTKHFKKNWFLDKLVWLGIKGASFLPLRTETRQFKITRYVLVSNKEQALLQRHLKKPIMVMPSPDKLEWGTEIIFDAHFLTYRKIIGYMANSSLNVKATFKIFPKDSNYVLGSNSSKSRGEVIEF